MLKSDLYKYLLSAAVITAVCAPGLPVYAMENPDMWIDRQLSQEIEEVEESISGQPGSHVRVQINNQVNTSKGINSKTEIRVESQGNTSIYSESSNNSGSEKDSTSSADRNIEIKEDGNLMRLKLRMVNGEYFLETENIGANSKFPITLSGNQIIITTPSGSKVKSILPDQAIDMIIKSGILDVFTPHGQVEKNTNFRTSLDITDKKGKLVYRMPGEKTYRFLGLIKIKSRLTVYAGVEDGKPVSITKPWYLSYLPALFF